MSALHKWLAHRKQTALALNESLLSAELVADSLGQYSTIIDSSDKYTWMTRQILIHQIAQLQSDLAALKAARGWTFRFGKGGDAA